LRSGSERLWPAASRAEEELEALKKALRDACEELATMKLTIFGILKELRGDLPC